jgi:PleD family two-component response regulator
MGARRRLSAGSRAQSSDLSAEMRLDITRIAAQWWKGTFLKYMHEQSAPLKPFRGSETILLVEDEAPVRKMTTLLLERLGYQVQKASSGEEALRLARGSREQIDLLLTDVLMPGMSGCELAEVLPGP